MSKSGLRMRWGKGQGEGACYKHYLVKKGIECNGLCFRVISDGPNFLSIKRVTSNISFESKMELSEITQLTSHEIMFICWTRATDWALSSLAAKARKNHDLTQGQANIL